MKSDYLESIKENSIQNVATLTEIKKNSSNQTIFLRPDDTLSFKKDSNKNESNAQLSDESKDDKSEKSRKPSFDEYSVKNAESSSLAEVEARINIPSSSKVNKPAEENNPKPNVPPIINLAEINTIAEEDSLKTSYRESEDENRSEKEVKESDKDKTEPSIEIKRDTLFSNTNNQKNIFGKGTTTADSIPQK